jgi:hypothetical protein
MTIIDEGGKPATAKPSTGDVTEAPEKQQHVPMGFVVPLNRPGKFTVVLKATDKIANKSRTLRFPLTVLPNDLKAK